MTIAGPALDVDALLGLSSETWLEFLRGRRWFPAGARAVRLIAAAPVGRDAALCLLGADAERPWMTQVLLHSMSERACSEDHLRIKHITLTTPRRQVAVIEACDVPQVFTALAASLRIGATFRGAGASWAARPTTATWTESPTEQVALVGGDQSNTAAVFSEAGVIFKLLRRVEVGRHPELELGRFLTACRFPYAPPLLAELTVETAEGEAAAGVLHRFLPGLVDGWKYALAHADMTAEARALGVATRAMHETLTTDDESSGLATRAIVAGDRARWIAGLRATASAALGRLAARYQALPPRARALAEVAAARSEALLIDAEERLRAAAGVQIRIHGDYHLGQVLFDMSHNRWTILDFEGEPTRPLAERSLRQLPLRDVAGMLRSFAYAALVGGGGASWEAATSAAFLNGYDGAAAPGSPLPSAHASPLLRACVIERTFHELAYELDYRPQHAWIPLSSLVALAATSRPTSPPSQF